MMLNCIEKQILTSLSTRKTATNFRNVKDLAEEHNISIILDRVPFDPIKC